MPSRVPSLFQKGYFVYLNNSSAAKYTLNHGMHLIKSLSQQIVLINSNAIVSLESCISAIQHQKRGANVL